MENCAIIKVSKYAGIVEMAFAGQHKHTTDWNFKQKYFDIHQISSALLTYIMFFLITCFCE